MEAIAEQVFKSSNLDNKELGKIVACVYHAIASVYTRTMTSEALPNSSKSKLLDFSDFENYRNKLFYNPE